MVVSILCAWLCARFAPGRSARHILWFFVIGEAMGIAAIIPNWSKGWPHWYWLSWLLTWPVSCWIGWLLAGRRAGLPNAQAIRAGTYELAVADRTFPLPEWALPPR